MAVSIAPDFLAVGAGTGRPATGILTVHSLALNDYGSDFDGQWQGITVASDGMGDFASSTHSDRHGAGFFWSDPVRQIEWQTRAVFRLRRSLGQTE